MAELSFNLDFDVTLFTGEFDSLGVANLAHGELKRYNHVPANRLCPIKIEENLKRNHLLKNMSGGLLSVSLFPIKISTHTRVMPSMEIL